ncbi:hypothetical protein ACX83D_19325, partial [Burkholderia pseudomallei]
MPRESRARGRERRAERRRVAGGRGRRRPAGALAPPTRERPMATPVRSAHASRRASAAAPDTDAARDARYENPFAPPDEA